MRPTHFLTAVLGLILVFGTGWLPAQAGGHAGGKAISHMSSKGLENTNAQWSAGAERGRARAEERHKIHNLRRSKQHDSADIRSGRLDKKDIR